MVLLILLLPLGWTIMASGNAGSTESRSEHRRIEQCDPDMKRILDSVSLSHLVGKFAAEKVHTYCVNVIVYSPQS